MRQAAAWLTPRWLARLWATAGAADVAAQRKAGALVERLTPRWWRKLCLAADAFDRAWQRPARAAVARLTPPWLPRTWDAGRRLAGNRRLERAVLAITLLVAAVLFVRLMGGDFINQRIGDAAIYWNAIRADHLYPPQNDVRLHGYLYSPAFAQVFWPILALPWQVFYGIWLGLMFAIVIWLARPWLSLAVFALCFRTVSVFFLAAFAPKVALESGNIWLLLALAAVAGFRWPWAYAFPLLTKVTPGVTVLWFVGRGEWRNLFIALGATCAIALVSFVIAPGLWFDWFGQLRYGATLPAPAFAYPLPPLAIRVALAALLTLVAARYDLKWVVPIATFIAIPFIDNTTSIVLLGVFPLLRHDAWTEPRKATAGEASPVAGEATSTRAAPQKRSPA